MSVPVLVVTGFLGAGKTSFINQLLQGDHGLRIAAIVNDFGSINIDAALLDSAADGVIGLKNGCICCSLQGDLLRTLKRVLGRGTAPDFGPDLGPELIVIEASGVADPAGIVQSLIDPVIWQQARLETVICVIDAPDVAARRDDPLWQAQLRGSDLWCLAKTQGMRAEAVASLRATLAVQGRHPVFDLAEPVPLAALFIPEAQHRRTRDRAPLRDDRFAHLEWQHAGVVNLHAFQTAMAELAPSLLRAKGFIVVDRAQRLLFQLAGTRATLARAPDGRGEGCQLVLIGDRAVFDVERARVVLDGLKLA